LEPPQDDKRQIAAADRESAAAIIAESARELEQLAEVAGLEVLARLLGLVKAEAELKMRPEKSKSSGGR
jgi:regulator of protease activity HflC (stomatin/prohibitin superfamily)